MWEDAQAPHVPVPGDGTSPFTGGAAAAEAKIQLLGDPGSWPAVRTPAPPQPTARSPPRMEQAPQARYRPAQGGLLDLATYAAPAERKAEKGVTVAHIYQAPDQEGTVVGKPGRWMRTENS